MWAAPWDWRGQVTGIASGLAKLVLILSQWYPESEPEAAGDL